MWKTTIISPSSQQANYTVIVFVSDNTYMWLDLISKLEIFWIHHLTDRTGIGEKNWEKMFVLWKTSSLFFVYISKTAFDDTAIFVLWRKDFRKSLTLVSGTKFTDRHMLTGCGLPAPHVPAYVKIFLPPTSESWNSYGATSKSKTDYHFQLLQYHDQRLHCVGKMKEDDPVPSNFSISYWIPLFQHKELLLTKYRK